MGEKELKGSFHQLCKIHRCLNFSYHKQNRRLKESGKKWPLKDEPVGEGWDLSILSYAVYSSRNQTEVYWPYFPFLFLLFPGHLISRAGTIALGTLGSRVTTAHKACWVCYSLLQVFRISINPAYQKFSPQHFPFGSLNPSAATLSPILWDQHVSLL